MVVLGVAGVRILFVMNSDIFEENYAFTRVEV